VELQYETNMQLIWNRCTSNKLAGQDLHRLTSDEHGCLRQNAAKVLGIVFRDVPDKQQAWQDLHRLTLDEDQYVRLEAEVALRTIFRNVPDKQQAWEDLVRLTSDEYIYLRQEATKVLGIVFKDVPDEQQVWEDLHRLASDENREVRREIAEVFGTVFKNVPDKEQVWKDLHRLTSDKDTDVRVGAYHSFGRISIYKTSQSESEEGYLEELEKAIEFFEIAAKESNWWNNPSSFCLPFYRSFYAIVSAKKREAKDEVEKYLSEAKNSIYFSKNKKLLLEAVENLENALKEVQNLENMDLEAKKGELNFYRKYCEKAADLMAETEKTSPHATIILRKGLPILDRKLKSLLKEIQDKAKTACRESQGTDTQEIACAVSREVQKWEIGSQEEMSWYVENLIFTLEANVPKAPENQAIFSKIEQIREEKVLVKQYAILCSIIPMIPNLHVKQAISGLTEEVRGVKEAFDTLSIVLKPGIKEEIEISSGIDILGTGAKHIVTIPLQEISYDELKDDLKGIKGKHITKLSRLPERLARKIKGYLLLNDREDLVEQLS